MATQEALCQVCFEVKKCRTKYMGRVGLFVCTNSDCLTMNTDRKKEAKQLADAKKAAAKKTLQEAKEKERAAKTAAKAHARSPAGRSPRNPAAKKAATGAVPFYEDPDKVTDDLSGEDNAVGLRAAAPTLAAGSTPSRPPSARKNAGKTSRFIADMAEASESDGVEEEGIETPDAMRDFVVRDHQSEEAASRSRARSTGATPHDAAPASPACSFIGTPTSGAGAAPVAGERRARVVFSPGPATPAGSPGSSRVLPDSAFGRRRRRRRLHEEDAAPEGVRGSLSPDP